MKVRLLCVIVWLIAGAVVALGQSTSFTYQGRLTDGGTAANGNYDLQFALWNSLSSGTQVGSTQTINTVAVSNGVFTVSLDFGANAFPGASRFLEIGARPAGSGSFTPLTPRQEITSTPYAVRSLNAASADSVPASGVPAGSGNYIQNSSSPQAASNFNISSDGTAGGTLTGNVVNATTQYNLNGSRILSNPGLGNLFVGAGAGNTAHDNTFVGSRAGAANTTGDSNSVFGSAAGLSNTSGRLNAFFGAVTGNSNTTGGVNSFFGAFAGLGNSSGGLNTLIGFRADVLSLFTIDNATAIGANARVDASNALVLGSINGINGAAADTNVGIGTTAPAARLHVVGTTGLIGDVGIGTTTPAARLHVNDGGGHILFTRAGCNAPLAGIMFASSVTGACTNYALLGGDGNTHINRPSGGGIFFREGNFTEVTIKPGGVVAIENLGAAGPPGSLCRNANKEISTCSSSLRYKSNVEPFVGGLGIINRLRPISFKWKQGGAQDIGLGAEEVEKVEPLLTYTNDKGEIEGVKYNQLSAVFVNAFKEQQAQIAQQQKQIEGLKKLVCRSHARAAVCK